MNTFRGMNNYLGAEEAQNLLSSEEKNSSLCRQETPLNNKEACLAPQFALLKLTLNNG